MLQPVRGTHDLLPDLMARQRMVHSAARRVASFFSFEEMATPIFEFSNVFHRLGESSDIVSKETYTFQDRGGEELTLRPEGTAPVMRAIVSNGLTQSLPLRFLYIGPMFRYDRPQKGRYRQFEQVGVELVGPMSPAADLEVLAFAHMLLTHIGVRDQVKLHINTLGDKESRARYRETLVAYLTPFAGELSVDSQRRLGENPLRILDSKEPQDRKILENAPSFEGALSPESAAYFQEVCAGLDALKIAYHIDRKLVRGLDYYCHTAFEFICETMGAQGTVLAGGRYEGLTSAMGGPDIPGVGWAAGTERLRDLSPHAPEKPPLFYLVPMGEAPQRESITLANALREAGLCVKTDMGGGNMGKRLKRADASGAACALILGEDELERGEILVKDLASGTQITLALDALAPYLKKTFDLKD